MDKSSIVEAVADFAKLNPADRRAIERLLPSTERAALRQALSPTPANPPPDPPHTKPDLAGYSPRLSKHVLQVLHGKGAAKCTEATRAALRDLTKSASRLRPAP